MTILNYTFKREEDYAQKVTQLSHHGTSYGEFNLTYSTGKHVITATVESPSNESFSPLAHGAPMKTLDDVLLILSLFTGREVFSTTNSNISDNIAIARDFRPYLCYETLGVSIPPRLVKNDRGIAVDFGFEEDLDKVLRLIHTKEWLEKFEQGQLLFIARQIFTFQVLEKAFLMSYVFWEHVFYMEKRTSMSDKQIIDTDGAQKVRFLLEAYGFTLWLNGQQKDCIQKILTDIRNTLAHYGVFDKDKHSHNDAIKFIELTTRLLAKILGLEPSDGKNTKEWLEEMLNRNVAAEISASGS